MVRSEVQASYPRLTAEYTFPTSPIASTSHQPSETSAEAGTDGFVSVGPPDELKDRASDCLGDDETSSVEAYTAMPSNKLRENDYVKPTELGYARRDENSPAIFQQKQEHVQSLKEGREQVCPTISTS
jgi:hypothetical protein